MDGIPFQGLLSTLNTFIANVALVKHHLRMGLTVSASFVDRKALLDSSQVLEPYCKRQPDVRRMKGGIAKEKPMINGV